MVNTQILAELANAQGAAYVNGDKLPWTAGKPKDYRLFAMLMQGRDMYDTYTSGTSIKTQFDPKIESSDFAPKRHGEDHKRGGKSSMDWMSSPMSEYEWNTGILWHDIHLQAGDVFSQDGSQRFYKILEKRERDFRLDPLIKMEKALGAVPTADMFTADEAGKFRLKSIMTGVNLWEKKHYATGGGEGLFPVMADQQGLDPEDKRFARVDGFGNSQLACHKVFYGEAGTNNTNIPDHLLDRMQYFIDTLGWEPVPMGGEWGAPMDVSPSVFMCSHESKVMFNRTNRAHGDFYATINPIGDASQGTPSFAGIPLLSSSTIREGKYYPDVQRVTGLDEDGAAARFLAAGEGVDEFDPEGTPGPVFYAVDPRGATLRMHAERAWVEGPWKSLEPVNEDEMRKLGKFLGNIHFESFVTSGILAPNKAISGHVRGAGAA